MTARIDTARERLGNAVFRDWSPDEMETFVRLIGDLPMRWNLKLKTDSR